MPVQAFANKKLTDRRRDIAPIVSQVAVTALGKLPRRRTFKMVMKLSATLAIAAGLAVLSSTGAQAGPRHWFYGEYGYFDGRAYNDAPAYYDEGFEDDYANPPRRYSQRELRRFRAWAHRQNQLVRERRAQRRARNRARRQRLYDLWIRQGDGWRGRDYYGDLRPKQRAAIKPQPRRKLSYVPIPRDKPYHLLGKAGSSAKPTAMVPNPKGQVSVSSLPALKRSGSTAKTPIKVKSVTTRKSIAITSTGKAKPVRVVPAKRARPVKVASVRAKPVTPLTGSLKPVKIVVGQERTAAKKAKKPKLPISSGNIARNGSKNPVSCARARTIVSGFGFGNVRTITCRGKTYHFDATRDGKPYNIKISALSGELKQVNRLK